MSKRQLAVCCVLGCACLGAAFGDSRGFLGGIGLGGLMVALAVYLDKDYTS